MPSKKIRLIAKKPIVLETIRTTFEGPLGLHNVAVTREAWQCTICKKWEEFKCIKLDGATHIAKGCGAPSHFYEGHRIDHCFDCTATADKMMGVK